MRINRRLMLLVAVPLVVAVGFSLRALAPAIDQAFQAHRLTQMVDTADAGASLTAHLQRERAAANALVASQGDETAFAESTEATDAAIADYQHHRNKLSSVPDSAAAALERIDRSLAELPSLRAQVRSGTSTMSALAFGYRIIVADLIDYRDGLAQADGVNADVADRIRAAAALSQASEHLAQQQVVVQRAMAGGGFTPAAQRAFEATRLGYTESTGVLFALGPPQWRSWLERTLSGSESLAAQRLEDEVGRTAVGQDIEVSAQVWLDATSDRLALLRSVERRVDRSVHATVIDTRSSLTWWAVGEVLLVLLTLVGALAVAVRLGRVMIRRLRELRNAARDVATQRLPKIVTDLTQPGALGGATPEQVADNSGNPVSTTGDDEIGEVGEAFNSVHHAAVRLAAEQAHSHEQFAETLVGMARRGAQLTSVMVSELDAVQRDEADPERMQVLFALDHLAIRMERNTNNLLVLGGYGNARVRDSDVSCATVVIAAAQQIERFDRVSLGIIEPGIGIAARVVHDLAHILAELLDNATRYSPPDKQVGVAVWRLADRAVVQIVDEGVGISPERRDAFNARLAEPRADVGGVRSMGLPVVARLAARHGIIVELRDSSGPGTIAEITLPPSVLVDAPRESLAESEQSQDAMGLPDDPADASPFIPPPRRQRDQSRILAGAAGRGGPGQRAAAAAMAGEPQTAGEPQQADDESEGPRRPQFPPDYDPAERIAGVSSSGLPVRMRQPPEHWPRFPKRDGAAPRPGATGATGTVGKGRRRDSRQISDVLAAYTQGISRSAAGRKRPTSNRPRSANDDDTQRST